MRWEESRPMGLLFNAQGWRRVAGASGLIGLLLVLSACGRASESTRNVTSMLMGPAGGGTSTIQGQRPEQPGGPICPGIVVRDGTETLRVYERGFEGDARRLVYQGSVTTTARECSFIGERGVSMKFGVAGRLITGPRGQPGRYELPVRVAFVRVGGEPVWTQLYRVPVTVLPGETSARFNHVEENLSYELREGESFGFYVLYVGFDEVSR